MTCSFAIGLMMAWHIQSFQPLYRTTFNQFLSTVDNVIGGLKDQLEQPGDVSHDFNFCYEFYKDINRARLQPKQHNLASLNLSIQ